MSNGMLWPAAATVLLVLSIGSDVRAAEKATTERSEPAAGAVRVSAGVSLPAGRGNHAGGMVDGKVVVAGGTAWNADRTVKSWLGDTLVFRDGTWTPGPELPHAVSEPAFASDGKALYVVGGRRGASAVNDTAYRLAEVDGHLRWDALPKLPEPTTAAGAGIVGERLFVACGSARNAPVARLLALDATTADAKWVDLKPLPGPERMYPAVCSRDGSLYVLGGMRPTQDAAGKRGMEVFRDAYRYDTRSAEWTRLPDLPAPGYCWAADTTTSADVVVAGRADGAIHRDVLLLRGADLHLLAEGKTVIQTTCAPLVRVTRDTWWLVGGEPDAMKTRTEKVSIIELHSPQTK